MTDPALRGEIRTLYSQLNDWLLQSAYPLWYSRGVDRHRGGFHEGLTQSGEPLQTPRRARVQARQIFAFSQPNAPGWHNGIPTTALEGVDYFLTHYKRPDGLIRTLVDQDGTPLNNDALLYDQAFALFALASVHKSVQRFELEAENLWSAIQDHLERTRLSNPLMHLFEATIAWSRVGGTTWQTRADELGEFALRRLIDPSAGFIRETYSEDWTPAPTLEGRIVEPGHQFEWAWLLLSWDSTVTEQALRLVEFAETHGVRHGIAVNALLTDGSIHDARARIWPQTERLRTAALVSQLTNDPRYWQMTRDAAVTLLRYLTTPLPGLWNDVLLPSGDFQLAPANAGLLYHIIGPITELGNLTR
jgi:mannose/cellobiose epimerase-like protein (N-acyl-D-glucosamine 2-epimerase family)